MTGQSYPGRYKIFTVHQPSIRYGRSVPGACLAILAVLGLVAVGLSYPQPTQDAYRIEMVGQAEPPFDDAYVEQQYDYEDLSPRAQSLVRNAIESDDGTVVVYGTDATPAQFEFPSGTIAVYAVQYDGRWYDIWTSGPSGIGDRTDEFLLLSAGSAALLVGGYAAFTRPAPRRAGGAGGLVIAVWLRIELEWSPILQTIPELLGPDTYDLLGGLFVLVFVAGGVTFGEWCRRTAAPEPAG
ncbi:MAG: hypothetical protein ABEJ08_00400 [Halobacteriaceae archaeon]